MKNIFYLFLASFIICFVSCKDDEAVPSAKTATVEVNFIAEDDDDALAMYENITYPETDNAMRFKKIQFYVSNLVLLKSGTEDATELSEIELVDFSNLDTEDAAERGVAYAYSDIPLGEYSGIRFGLGVARDLNVANNGAYAPSDPLGQNWWAGWESFIFSKFEGNVSTDGDDSYDGENDIVFTLHTGGNDAYRIVTLTESFIVSESDNIIKIEIDTEKIFKAEDDTVYNIIEYPQAHTANAVENIAILMDNFSKAFSIK